MAASILKRNNVRTFGKGIRPMLFAHGFGCDQTMWRFITPAFEDHYRIVLFDYVGCGSSDKSCYDPLRYADLGGYAQDILDICRVLHLHNVIFVGHSVSAMIGTLAANSRAGLFSKMIMLGPSACYINDLSQGYHGGFEHSNIDGLLASMEEEGSTEWAGHLSNMVIGNPDRPEIVEELRTMFCDLDPEYARRFAEIVFRSDSRAELGKLKVPTLVMHCEDDMVAPGTASKYVHESIAASIHAIIPDAKGHMPQMSAPAETIIVMKEYLYADQD